MFSLIQESPVLTTSPASNKPLQLRHGSEVGGDQHTEEAARQLHARLNTSVPSGSAHLQETSCVHLMWRNVGYHVYKIVRFNTRRKGNSFLLVKTVLLNPCFSYSFEDGEIFFFCSCFKSNRYKIIICLISYFHSTIFRAYGLGSESVHRTS